MHKKDTEKTCFVICPLGKKDSPERKRSDDVFDLIIVPVCKNLGYKAVRPDKLKKPGLLDLPMFQLLEEADIVIADLTDHNPNVFYELAVRHALDKPAILIIEDGQDIPFDINKVRVISFEYSNPRSIETCKQEIEEHIGAFENDHFDYSNPLKIVKTLLETTRGGFLGQDLADVIISRLEDISETVDDLKWGIEDMDRRIPEIESQKNSDQHQISFIDVTITSMFQEIDKILLGLKRNPSDSNVLETLIANINTLKQFIDSTRPI